jgi:hypothetical protein
MREKHGCKRVKGKRRKGKKEGADFEGKGREGSGVPLCLGTGQEKKSRVRRSARVH